MPYSATKDAPKSNYQVLLCLVLNTKIGRETCSNAATAAFGSYCVHKSVRLSIFSQRHSELEVELFRPRLISQFNLGSELSNLKVWPSGI